MTDGLDAEASAHGFDFGRPSIAPERSIRASLIQISTRSERQLMELTEDDLLFRWVTGLGIDGEEDRKPSGLAQSIHGGIESMRCRFILTMTENTFARLPRFLAAR